MLDADTSQIEQSGKGRGNRGLARLVNRTALLLSEHPGEGPWNGRIAMSETKGQKRKLEVKDINKFKAVIEVEAGNKTKRQIALEFNIPSLSTWIKKKKSIQEGYLQFRPKHNNTRTGMFENVQTTDDDDDETTETRLHKRWKPDDMLLSSCKITDTNEGRLFYQVCQTIINWLVLSVGLRNELFGAN